MDKYCILVAVVGTATSSMFLNNTLLEMGWEAEELRDKAKEIIKKPGTTTEEKYKQYKRILKSQLEMLKMIKRHIKEFKKKINKKVMARVKAIFMEVYKMEFLKDDPYENKIKMIKKILDMIDVAMPKLEAQGVINFFNPTENYLKKVLRKTSYLESRKYV
uniref:Uncharacterized protein n=1 Tax=Clastoptera arizonana TaxID=38151 RepID=A0A1B6DFG3_9HEMI